MLTHRTQGFAAVLALCELGVATAVFWLWVLAWDSASAVVLRSGRCLFFNELLLVGVVLGMGNPRRQATAGSAGQSSARLARRQTVAGMLALALALVASDPSRELLGFLLGFAPLLYASLRLSKHFLPGTVGPLLFGAGSPEKVLLVGARSDASRLVPWMRSKESLGWQVVGWLYDAPSPSAGSDATTPTSLEGAFGAGWDPQGTEWKRRLPDAIPGQPTIPGSKAGPVWSLPWLGSTADVERVLDGLQIRQMLVVGLRWPEGFLRRCVALCEARGIRLHVVSDLDEHFQHSVILLEDSGVQLIGLREEPLESPLNQFAKRLMDLAIALPVSLVVLPATTILVWLLHRWQSPGPVFFRQLRSGFQGKPFRIYKYRSLHVQAESDTVEVRRSDRRVFPAGAWLRKLSLDELPQFLNVLRGEMSVVGPRPHIPQLDLEYARIRANYRVRAVVKPGITGLAQVRGYRGGTQLPGDIVRRVDSDIEYLERWTLGLDLWIVVRTAWQILSPPRGAF